MFFDLRHPPNAYLAASAKRMRRLAGKVAVSATTRCAASRKRRSGHWSAEASTATSERSEDAGTGGAGRCCCGDDDDDDGGTVGFGHSSDAHHE